MKTPKTIICCVVGTRPEAIKMAPVILELRRSSFLEPFVLATGQHTDMLRQALDFFGICADKDLAVMKENQSLDYITASVLEKVGQVLDDLKPFMVLVHGDTTTTMAASLAAFYRKIPLAHVEAGLRSGNINLPFPEELNRIVSDRVAGWWFPPTEGAKDNLLREGFDPSRIIVTGNTVIDALLWSANKVNEPASGALKIIPGTARVMLLTAHRRESWGEPLKGICRAVIRILEDFPDLWVIIPMHRNPQVRSILKSQLGDIKSVVLCDPLDYPDFVWSMKRSDLILTDSGGVQEETTVLGTPTLVMRDVTERPEAVKYGTSVLVGTNPERIHEMATKALKEPQAGAIESFKYRVSPFGAGNAAQIIIETIEDIFRKS
ncbi:MAG: UDP-N-acetylglucosamine 2-epimerase (non-hydrolyzing) [Thermovirgaceae bacterium]|nr:UDP-N-acetylglucosamine 2-epimerase (non-hydrolyzing) [Thermovirgaceae bacterium]